MSARGEEMFDEILVLFRGALARRHADHALAAAALRAVGTDVRALDQSVVRESDDDALVRNQIFNGNLAFVRDQVRHAGGGVLLFDGPQLGLDDVHDPGFLGEDIEQIFDSVQELGVFGADLVDLQAGQLVEA